MKRLRESLVLMVLLGLGVACGGAGTFAAWASATSNPNNKVTTGSIDVTDDDGNTSMFATYVGIQPGPLPSKCMTVTNASSVSIEVALYGQISGNLVDYLDIRVTRGAAGATCASMGTTTTLYDGELNAFPTTSAAALEDGTTWLPNQSRPYRFDVTLEDDPNAQGKTASVGMTWEGRA